MITTNLTKKNFEKSEILSLNYRDQYTDVVNFLKNKNSSRILLLQGLKYTGKKTLALQAMHSEEAKKIGNSAIVLFEKDDKISNLQNNISQFYENGVRILLIENATEALNFSCDSSIFSDIYSGLGMKIIMIASDSLKFILAKRDGLFDRTVDIHTTFFLLKNGQD